MQSELSTWISAIAIAQFWLAPPILALSISALYFFTSPAQQRLSMRLLASSHGVVTAALYIGALVISGLGASKPSLGLPFSAGLIAPLVLIALSFFIYRGRGVNHIAHVLSLLCVAWTFFIGGMAITGNWL